MHPQNELIEKIQSTIDDASIPLWFPNLTEGLADEGWQELNRTSGLTKETYRTTRLFLGKNDLCCKVFKSLCALSIELLPWELQRRYEIHGISFYDVNEMQGSSIASCLTEAIAVIGSIQSLWSSTSTLVNSMHLIKPIDDEIDVSFSEPEIPFSIFVSVPRGQADAGFLRVSEAIIHEAMHLQLSLLEKVKPLITCQNKTLFSPWKKAHRTVDRVLHGLYVFRVIDDFYGELQTGNNIDDKYSKFISQRRNEIGAQLALFTSAMMDDALSKQGLRLVRRILDSET